MQVVGQLKPAVAQAAVASPLTFYRTRPTAQGLH